MATETSDPQQEKEGLSAAEQDLKERGLYDQLPSAGKSESSAGLSKKESAGSGGGNFTYNPSTGKTTKASKSSSAGDVAAGAATGGASVASRVYSKALGSNKKKAGAAGLIATIIAIFVALFLFTLPLKILHIMNNLQNKFYATSENAVDKETNRLFTNYIKQKALFGMKGNCRGNKTIDSGCNPFSAGDTLVTRLYRGWSDGKLEDKLSNNYGIDFRYQANENQYYIRVKSVGVAKALDQGFLDGTDSFDTFLDDKSWTPATRQQVRQAVKTALEDETRYKRTMYRIKVGRLLERKYGIKRCIIGCKIKDNYADWKDNKKRAAKMYLAERVLKGRFETFGLLYTCLLDPNCKPEQFSEATPETVVADAGGCQSSCDTNGEPLSEKDREARSIMTRLLASYGGDVAKLLDDYNAFRDKGFIYAVLKAYAGKARVRDDGASIGKNLAGKLAETAAVQQAGNFIPILGQINMGANIVNGLDTLTVALPKMAYVMNAASAAQYFTMYRTVADETKEGNVDPEILGSFVTGLGPGIQVDAGKDQLGGTAEAETTPLYQSLIGNSDTNTKFSSLTNLFAPKAAAATADYTCANGSPVPAGQLTCGKEEKVKQDGNEVIQTLSTITSSGAWGVLRQAASAWQDGRNAVAGPVKSVVDQFANFFCKVIPICDDLEDAGKKLVSLVPESVKSKIQDALLWVLETIFGFNVNLVSNNMSGGKAFDVLAAGADVSGNSFGQNGLGGTQLSDTEVAQIAYEQEMQRYQDYQNQPFLARIFDKDSDYSLVSKVAMSMPSSKSTALNNAMAKLSSPLDLISGIFGSMLSFGRVNAAPPLKVIPDPFGVTQYGYPADDPTLTKLDPDAFWTTYCTTTNDGSSDPNAWSLTKLYNSYSALTAQANVGGAYDPVNNAPTTDIKFPDPNRKLSTQEIAMINAFKTKSPKGTNRCLLIQAATGSAGALFTDDVLSPDEKSGSTTTQASSSGNTQGGGTVSLQGANQSSTQCDPRTKDLGVYQGYSGGQPTQIRICSLPNLPCGGDECLGGYGMSKADGHALVNAAASTAFYNLVEAGNAALPSNLTLSANSSFRTMSHQEYLCSKDDLCSNGDYTFVAKPGTSNHQMGLAVDFDIKGISETRTACIPVNGKCTAQGYQDWEWLSSNSERFGLKQYVNEFWHFSPTGN